MASNWWLLRSDSESYLEAIWLFEIDLRLIWSWFEIYLELIGDSFGTVVESCSINLNEQTLSIMANRRMTKINIGTSRRKEAINHRDERAAWILRLESIGEAGFLYWFYLRCSWMLFCCCYSVGAIQLIFSSIPLVDAIRRFFEANLLILSGWCYLVAT